MKMVIELSDYLYKCLRTRIKFSVESEIDRVVAKGQILPDDCEILTKEAYEDLCKRASMSEQERWLKGL